MGTQPRGRLQHRTLRDLWAGIWKPPDPQLRDAGFSAEVLVAGIRLLLVILLLYIPLIYYRDNPFSSDNQVMLGIVAAGLVEALLVYSAVRRNWGRQWLGFASSITDATLVTAGLVIFLILDQPLAATNSMLIYPFYFLVLGATSLRYDPRICLLTGLAATLQYLGVVIAASRLGPLMDPGFFSPEHGRFSWGDQVGRTIFLVAATLLATLLVVRTRDTSTWSIRDRLTGLLNRRVFDHRLHAERAQAERLGYPLAVAMIDLDRFKQFNDTFGHEGGDEALKAVGALLSRAFRTTDVVARYGGEEFAVLLPGINPMNAFKRLEGVRIEVAREPVRVRGRDLPAGLTLSVGIAFYPDDGDDIQAVLAVADQRLYQAKEQGRNRVVCPIDIDVPLDPPAPLKPRPEAVPPTLSNADRQA
jgi:diguanylate cyclase (GGDEF)-like protein